jgi:hypothetical protein
VWAILQMMQPALTDTSILLSYRRYHGPDDQQYVDVSGTEPGDPQHWAIVDWAEWLSMPIVLGEGLEDMPLSSNAPTASTR